MLSEVVMCLSGDYLALSVRHLYNQMKEKDTFHLMRVNLCLGVYYGPAPTPELVMWEGRSVLEETHSGLAFAFLLKIDVLY